ncbi:cathelicidin-related peptide Oh-Cath-like [Hemicordylus capensis]|uniref:cathelicidin-related peptide Oh-Cath-like n=1 Tax=Hemicordylus capensis TaxID=884348 RepID=UPI002302E4EE|nr:cathelicidin-related peptide Oh-Cath-like [Hemicordylus capensis]
MERSFWKVLMMVGAAAAAITLAPRQKPLTYKEAVMLAVDLYNERAAENFTFRLINAIPQPEWDANSKSTQELNFTIKETGCPAQEECPEEESSFRCDGLVKACSGYYFLEEFPPVTIVSCDEVEDENSSSSIPQQLNFTIQETVCPASEGMVSEQCEFKPDGLMKDCSGYSSTEQANSLVVITCDAAVQKPVQTTRFRGLRGLLRGLAKGISRAFQ